MVSTCTLSLYSKNYVVLLDLAIAFFKDSVKSSTKLWSEKQIKFPEMLT